MRWLAVLALGGCGFAPAATPDAVVPDASFLCGNLVANADEECDDGNLIAGDGCNAQCIAEPAWQCPPAGPCVRVVGLAFSGSTALAPVGTSGGGGTYMHTCAAGEALVGFEGALSDDSNHIGKLRAACSPVGFRPDGRIVWSTVDFTSFQGGEMKSDLGATRCNDDELVAGYVGNADLYLSGLQLICLRVSYLHDALVFGAVRTTPTWGPATKTSYAPTACASGAATTTFEGKSGAVIDHFDLRCSAMTAITQ